jgi:hypothetical protein
VVRHFSLAVSGEWTELTRNLNHKMVRLFVASGFDLGLARFPTNFAVEP